MNNVTEVTIQIFLECADCKSNLEADFNSRGALSVTPCQSCIEEAHTMGEKYAREREETDE